MKTAKELQFENESLWNLLNISWANELKHKSNFQFSIYGISVLDLQGKIKDVNQSACNLFGYEIKEPINLNISHSQQKQSPTTKGRFKPIFDKINVCIAVQRMIFDKKVNRVDDVFLNADLVDEQMAQLNTSAFAETACNDYIAIPFNAATINKLTSKYF